MCKYTPIEATRSTHYGNNYYNTYSLKIKRTVTLFSQLEYMNYLTMEMNPKVKSFCEQPLKIKIENNGVFEYSIFDMWVQYKNRVEEFQEIKYSKDLYKSSNQYERTINQIKKQQTWCKVNGYNYIVRTELDIIRSPYYINNLRFLHGSLKRQNIKVHRRQLNEITSLISDKRIKIFEILHHKIIPTESVYPIIAIGFYDGIIELNIDDKIISYDTEVWLKKL